MTKQRYLGDAVYVDYDGYHLVLTTGSHKVWNATDKIFLDPEWTIHHLLDGSEPDWVLS